MLCRYLQYLVRVVILSGLFLRSRLAYFATGPQVASRSWQQIPWENNDLWSLSFPDHSHKASVHVTSSPWLLARGVWLFRILDECPTTMLAFVLTHITEVGPINISLGCRVCWVTQLVPRHFQARLVQLLLRMDTEHHTPPKKLYHPLGFGNSWSCWIFPNWNSQAGIGIFCLLFCNCCKSMFRDLFRTFFPVPRKVQDFLDSA